jgi:hypothetical protein
MKRTSIILKATGYIGLRGFVAGTVFGAAYGTLAYPIVGTLYGALIGAIIGLPVGLVGGALIGLITAAYFNPVTNAGVFRLIMPLSGGVIALAGAYLGFSVLFYGPGDTPYIVLPTLIAATSATYTGYSYARYYLVPPQADHDEASATTTHYESTTG